MCGNSASAAAVLWLALCVPLATLGQTAPAAPISPISPDDQFLIQRRLALPVEGVTRTDLQSSFFEVRASSHHEAIDIPALRGTKVFAVDDGKLVKLFRSVRGGLTVYQFDPTLRYAYYYAHLDRYADGVREGMTLKRCDLLGYVGTTGNARADSPHLHFAIFRLGPEARWWQGTAVDPYPALRGNESTAEAPACR